MSSSQEFKDFLRLRANPTRAESQADFRQRNGVVDLDPRECRKCGARRGA